MLTCLLFDCLDMSRYIDMSSHCIDGSRYCLDMQKHMDISRHINIVWTNLDFVRT